MNNEDERDHAEEQANRTMVEEENRTELLAEMADATELLAGMQRAEATTRRLGMELQQAVEARLLTRTEIRRRWEFLRGMLRALSIVNDLHMIHEEAEKLGFDIRELRRQVEQYSQKRST